MTYDLYYQKEKPGENDWCYQMHKYLKSEKELLDALCILHLDTSGQVQTESVYSIEMYFHVEEGQLVLNKRTHEIRRVYAVNKNTLVLYNSDKKEDTSNQERDGSPIFDEIWNRDDIIPILNEGGIENLTVYTYGTRLGVHPALYF